jgi:hypothetical protein
MAWTRPQPSGVFPNRDDALRQFLDKQRYAVGAVDDIPP